MSLVVCMHQTVQDFTHGTLDSSYCHSAATAVICSDLERQDRPVLEKGPVRLVDQAILVEEPRLAFFVDDKAVTYTAR